MHYKKINEDLSTLLTNINGRSAGPMWGTIFEGMSKSINDKDELDKEEIKEMFRGIKENLSFISKAKEGDIITDEKKLHKLYLISKIVYINMIKFHKNVYIFTKI